MDPEEGAAALVSGDVVMACLFGGNSIKAATAVGSRLLTVDEARKAGILGIDITSVTTKFMKENPGMLRTFIEVTHEANARYKAGKSDMNVMAKASEMKVGVMASIKQLKRKKIYPFSLRLKLWLQLLIRISFFFILVFQV